MSDFLTMVWKEIKDSVFSGGRGELIRPLIFVFILGILLPLQIGQRWLELSTSPVAVLIACYLPFFFISSYIGDAIAGERERHTLETLLASRISDLAILWGKVVVTVCYAWGMTFVGLLFGWIVANIVKGQGAWTFYHPTDILLETLALSLLVAVLATSGGSLISLKAATARQAQQTMTVGTLVLFVIFFLIIRAIPAETLAALNLSQFLLALMGGLFLLDLILLSILIASFKRSRLILS